MMPMLEGLKSIALRISTHWGWTPSDKAIWNYTRRVKKPLPCKKAGGKVIADSEKLDAWAIGEIKEIRGCVES